MTLLTAKDVARQLNIPYYRLEYLHKTGKIPEVNRASNNVRIYEPKDVEAIRRVLQKLNGVGADKAMAHTMA